MCTATINNLDPIDILAELRTTVTIPVGLAAALAGPHPGGPRSPTTSRSSRPAYKDHAPVCGAVPGRARSLQRDE